MVQKTPTVTELADAINDANRVAADARIYRTKVRRRSEPGGRRQPGLIRQINETKKAAKPLRKYLGMLQFHALPLEDAERKLRDASRRLQYERGQLRKMLR